MNKFVFITHVTPKAKRNSLRQELFSLYGAALNNQSYQNWIVIQLHEGADETESRFHRFHLPDVNREEKTRELQNLFLRNDFLSVIGSADYLIKLDDDDLISPNILGQLSDFNGDLYYDAYHTFFDITSGILTQQYRPWVASTCVHKTAHAMAEWKGEGASAIGNLLYSDHSKSWHQYYSGLNSVKADPAHPIYSRVLSPTSITSGGNKIVKTIGDVDFTKYYQYLHSFGEWTPAASLDFDQYREPMAKAWMNFSGTTQKPVPATSLGRKLKSRIGGLLGKLKGDH